MATVVFPVSVPRPPSTSPAPASPPPSCPDCRRPGHGRKDCPDWGGRCYRCGDKGHISRDCPKCSDRSSSLLRPERSASRNSLSVAPSASRTPIPSGSYASAARSPPYDAPPAEVTELTRVVNDLVMIVTLLARTLSVAPVTVTNPSTILTDPTQSQLLSAKGDDGTNNRSPPPSARRTTSPTATNPSTIITDPTQSQLLSAKGDDKTNDRSPPPSARPPFNPTADSGVQASLKRDRPTLHVECQTDFRELHTADMFRFVRQALDQAKDRRLADMVAIKRLFPLCHAYMISLDPRAGQWSLDGSIEVGRQVHDQWARGEDRIEAKAFALAHPEEQSPAPGRTRKIVRAKWTTYAPSSSESDGEDEVVT